ncbi:hypothetical protein DCC81_16660 [Chitinophaga parva]|uniref:DUF3857 domain-containing protein n=1 Tax=Chitinophaga parva TaxID=2169414 RepID=A0A2T7BHW5_9BACT|nr:DUF3857 domain-containing protein [Chitinophaga parva]PUZ25881.1 hypothetical protein DCC81_16660 [Chitinophaga parva]
MKLFRIYSLAAALVLCIASVQAQDRMDRRYDEDAAAARQAVWAWDLPAFNKPDFSKISTRESQVIVAKHMEVLATGKQRGDLGKGFYFIKTVRTMVKINDKAALDDYSELDFQKRTNESGLYSTATANYVGARIIKPDGTVKEVNVKDDAVSTKQTDWDRRAKLAIPDLQVGDILDFFVQYQARGPVSIFEQQVFAMGDDCPIMSYSIHCKIDNDFAIVYRAVNGAPEFKQQEEDGSIMLDLLVRNLPAMPTTLWMSPFRQIPLIRMEYLFNPRGGDFAAGHVYKTVSEEKVKTAALQRLSEFKKYAASAYFPEVGELKSMIRRYEKQRGKDIPKDSLSAYVYYGMRYLMLYKINTFDSRMVVDRSRNDWRVNNNKFAMLLSEALHHFDIDCDFIFATSRFGPDRSELLDLDDYEYILRTHEAKPVFMSAAGMFTGYAEMRYDLEGAVAPAFYGTSGKKFESRAEQMTATLPVSTAAENAHLEKMKVQLDNNMQLVDIKRTVTLKGHLRVDEQRQLMVYEDYNEAERKALGIPNTFMEEMSGSRRNKALIDDYTGAFADARKAVKDQFMSDIKGDFDNPVKELKSYSVDKMGLRHTDPDFVYSSDFTMEGLVKRAGNNYILDAGKLIGSQLTIKPSQRERKVDVYMPFARTYQYDIDLQVPKGYTVEGVDKLNRKVDNDCGTFNVTASQAGDVVTLHISKVYKNAFEPVAQWADVLKVVDAANDFQGEKLLLKKS